MHRATGSAGAADGVSPSQLGNVPVVQQFKNVVQLVIVHEKLVSAGVAVGRRGAGELSQARLAKCLFRRCDKTLNSRCFLSLPAWSFVRELVGLSVLRWGFCDQSAVYFRLF